MTEGHRVSAINVTKRRGKYGDYLFYVDHTSGIRSQDSPRSRAIFRPRHTLFVLGTLACICLGLYA